jgi:HAD superfamily hydrolase (TIGR01509 family)
VTGLADRACWLFDLDGTLVDSAPAHERAYRAALAELWPAGLAGFSYPEHAGRPTAEVVAGLGAPAAVVARKQALYRSAPVAAMPGALDLLASLAARGRPAYVVTGASRRSAALVLAATGLAPYVRGVLAAEDTAAGKPDPAPYAEACRRWAPGGPATAVAVEDSPAGVASALAAGLLTVQVGGVQVGGVPAPGVLAVDSLAALR